MHPHQQGCRRQFGPRRRTLQVKTLETALEGTLVAVLEEAIELEWKAREPKPIGKGKRTVEKKKRIAFDAIVEAKVKLIF
jgi:ribosome maturation factor RimP